MNNNRNAHQQKKNRAIKLEQLIIEKTWSNDWQQMMIVKTNVMP